MQAEATWLFENNYGINFKLAFNPVVDVSSGPKSAAFAINAVLEDEGRPFDVVDASGLCKAVAGFMRAKKDGWLHTLFIDLVDDAGTKFGGDLLAYADFVEGEFAWWGHFEWVVLGIVSKVEVYVLHGGVLRSTHGIKLEQELNEIPQEFLVEEKRKINLALVSLNDASKGPLDHYVVIIKHDVDEAMRCAQQAAADAPADELQQASAKAGEPPHAPGALVCTTMHAVSPCRY